MSELSEAILNESTVRVKNVEINDIENIDIEEQIVPLVIASGSVTDTKISYDFEGCITFSAEREGKSEFEFSVSFYGNARISKYANDIDLIVSLDEYINDYCTFWDEYGEEQDITAEAVLGLVKEAEDYEEAIYEALPSLENLIEND